ncbi:MAG: hypothetical protein ACTSO2_10410 [Promethearchaeota archaeon]
MTKPKSIFINRQELKDLFSKRFEDIGYLKECLEIKDKIATIIADILSILGYYADLVQYLSYFVSSENDRALLYVEIHIMDDSVVIKDIVDFLATNLNKQKSDCNLLQYSKAHLNNSQLSLSFIIELDFNNTSNNFK